MKASGRGILTQRNQIRITNWIAALTTSANALDIFDNPLRCTDPCKGKKFPSKQASNNIYKSVYRRNKKKIEIMYHLVNMNWMVLSYGHMRITTCT